MVHISGGKVGRFTAFPGSDVELVGGEYRLNGADFTDGSITISDGDILTGTFAGGSSFIFSDEDLDSLSDVTLTVVPLPPVDLNPIVINATDSGLSGLRAGQTLTLQAGGSLAERFEVVDATLNVEAGTVDGFAEVYNSEVNIRGGDVGSCFDAFSGSVVNISGGAIGQRFDAFSGSEVNISGGTVDDFFDACSGSVVNISGGTIGSGFDVQFDSVVNISGGVFGDDFDVFPGGAVNIRGREFSIDGMLLSTLQLGQAFTITDREVTLSGVLTDGESFSFDLELVEGGASGPSTPNDFFSSDATLTVTLVPPFLLGDSSLNGVVNVEDIGPFIAVLQTGSFLAQADCNQDGVVDFSDIPTFISILTGS